MCTQCVSVTGEQPTRQLLLKANSCNVALHNSLWTESCRKLGQRIDLTTVREISRRLRNYTNSHGAESTTEETSHDSIVQSTQVSQETRANVVDDVNVTCMAGILINLNSI